MTTEQRAGLLHRPDFLRWVQRQDHGAIAQITIDRSAPQLAVVIGVFIAIGAWAPGARTFFALHPLETALSFLPIALAALLQRTLQARPAGDPARWAAVAVGSLAVQFQAAALVAFSGGPGAWVFAAMLLYAVGFHGHVLRVNRDAWMLVVGTGFVVLAAALVAATPESRFILLMLVPGAVICEATAGTFAMRADADRIERDELRAAVQAQLLESQSARAANLEGTLVGVLGHSHDVNNAVTGALLDAEALRDYARSGTAPTQEEFVDLTESVWKALEQVRQLAHTISHEGRGGVARGTERVDARAVCVEAARTVGLRYAGTRITLDIPQGELPVFVSGGIASLRSVVDNLLLNACQGNGTQGASLVRVRAEKDPSGALLRLVVEDDGPGFQPDQLSSSISPFVTTKRGGTGLGLFTTERLVAASGGTVTRANRPEGGARVELALRYVQGEREEAA